MNSLVGYTGFVGSNLAECGHFDALYNSKNIREAFGTKPDLLVYAGIRSEMFLANNFPEKDLAQIKEAASNIEKICPKTLVLISTISVYGENACGDEDTEIDKSSLTDYGCNRLFLEEWVESNVKDYLIVRLPALYGKNLKKNFIYDYIHVIPKLLTYEKFAELSEKNESLSDSYTRQDNGFYKCRELDAGEAQKLKAFFAGAGFSALNFTDSRSRYQFYNLTFLWGHIQLALEHGIKKLNISTEPLSAAEVYDFLEHKEFSNELNKAPFDYNLKTLHSQILGGRNGYIQDKDFVLNDIKEFAEATLHEKER